MADVGNRRRRLAIIEVTPEWLAALLGRGTAVPEGRIVPDQVYEDLEIVAVRDGDGPPWRPRVQLMCRSASFDDVPDEVSPPHLQMSYHTEYVEPAAHCCQGDDEPFPVLETFCEVLIGRMTDGRSEASAEDLRGWAAELAAALATADGSVAR
ncbi:MAG: hypothetical protein HUU15_18855 [Candidatus Brocadiae bacterium]|nr:hypothetical protein [Candidatus Brocadiia bacterium]